MAFLQQILNGLALGSVYALIALGYTMVYGIIGLINFAHGDIYMVGAYIGFVAATTLHLPFLLVLVIAMAGSALLGILTEKIAYKPLRNSPKIALLITAIGVSFLLENGFAMKQVAGASTRAYPSSLLAQHIWHIGQLQLNSLQLTIFLIALLLVLILQVIVYKTKVGKAMRAASFDMDASKLMGINVDNVISVTFAIGSSLAGAAGVFVGILYNSINPYMGIMPGLKAFIAAVLGGIGVIPGALIGGFIMALSETLVKAYVSTKWSDAIAFAILIVILIFKPTGILGKKTREKV
ncbi:MAG: branched-chain amino acid ABC transporter permease [Bacillota bacterium]|nr:branched-chain amino acid ABC transporter permease [Bacillota bacterium]